MKRFLTGILASAALCVPSIAFAEPEVPPYSYAAMGCMKLRECTEGVDQLTSIDQLKEMFGYRGSKAFAAHEQEIIAILDRLDALGVKVYLAEGHNFPRNHRGSYYTDTNTFFLNTSYVYDVDVFMNVFRHEGWHAAQDCMAGTLDNTMIAVIHDEERVPQTHRLDAEIRYGPGNRDVIPWEAEAIWAGATDMMTADALNACATGEMWKEYSPTPMTREWLEKNGYINYDNRGNML